MSKHKRNLRARAGSRQHYRMTAPPNGHRERIVGWTLQVWCDPITGRWIWEASPDLGKRGPLDILFEGRQGSRRRALRDARWAVLAHVTRWSPSLRGASSVPQWVTSTGEEPHHPRSPNRNVGPFYTLTLKRTDRAKHRAPRTVVFRIKDTQVTMERYG